MLTDPLVLRGLFLQADPAVGAIPGARVRNVLGPPFTRQQVIPRFCVR
jgi:hypothetical protein